MRNKRKHRKLKRQVRNLLIVFFAIVLALSSSSLYLNSRQNQIANANYQPSQTDDTTLPGSTDSPTSVGCDNGVVTAVTNDSYMDASQNTEAGDNNDLSAETVKSDADSAQQVAEASTSADTEQTKTANLKEDTDAESFIATVSKQSGNRLIIGADNMPDSLLSTNSVAGYDSVWFASYDDDASLQSDYQKLKDDGYAVSKDLTVQVCDSKYLHQSWLDKLASKLRKAFGVLIRANDEQPLSEQIAKLDKSNQTVVLLDTGDNNADAAINLTDDALTDTNGHGTEMDKIIRDNAKDSVNVVSIKTVDDNGTGRLSDLLTGIMLAKTVSPSAINVSLSSFNQETADVVNTLIAQAADGKTAVVAAAGNQNADAANYLPGNASASITVGAADDKGELEGNSNYGDTVNYYVNADSTSKAAAQFTGLYINTANEIAEENNADVQEGTVSAEDSVSASPDSTPEASVASTAVPSSNTDTNSALSAVIEANNQLIASAVDANNKSDEVTPVTSAEPAASGEPSASPVAEATVTPETTVEPTASATVSSESEAIQPEVSVVLKRMARMSVLRTTANTPASTTTTNTSSAQSGIYISAAHIKEKKDGTAPFDSDNESGDDANDTNDIVRSFDSILYTIEYVTAIRDNTPVSSAKLNIEFTLPCTSKIAKWDTDAMAWMQDAKVTTNADGSQTITGYRLLENKNGATMIPGAGTLSVGIAVKAAPNGTVITPTFKFWLNDDRDGAVIVNSKSTTVSAKPSYDLIVIDNSGSEGCDFLAYVDTKTGKLSPDPFDGYTDYGRLQGMGIGFMLHQPDASKGMKGLEFPNGDITFDMNINVSVNGTDESNNPDYQTLLWEYRDNDDSYDSNEKGVLNRHMFINSRTSMSLNWRAPVNKVSYNRTKGGACYDGGNFLIVQDSTDHNKYHVTIKNYQFDYDNYTFPKNHNLNESAYGSWALLPSNEYWVSVGYVQTLARFPKTVDTTKNYLLRQSLSNFHATSASGQLSNAETRTNNNTWSKQITLYPMGAWYIGTWYDGSNASDGNHPGDGYAYVGQQNISITSWNGIEYETPAIGSNILQKFDAEAVTPKGVSYGQNASYGWIGGNGQNDCWILYGAKPDGKNWISDKEMEQYHEENLIYFTTLKELQDAGYTCVAVLFESRNESIRYGNIAWVQTPVTINQSAVVGKVYKTVDDCRVWLSGNKCARSWTTVKYPGVKGAYGLGDTTGTYTGTTYTADYSKPNWQRYHTNYQKTTYKDGVITGGHAGGYLNGNSLLIIGDMPHISIANNDTVSSGNVKTTYDMDKNERAASFKVSPRLSIVGASSHAQESEQKDGITVKITLPVHLRYKDRSAYWGQNPIKPTANIINSDGTQTLTFRMDDQIVGKISNDLTFSTIIGNAGTADDVKNNDMLEVSASIKADSSEIPISSLRGTLSKTSIRVIRLSALSLSKSTDNGHIMPGDDFTFRVRFANTSDNPVWNATVYDVLPYNGDWRGSKFDGNYLIDDITLDFSNAPKGFSEYANNTSYSYALSTTQDSSVRTNDFSKLSAFNSWNSLGNGTADANAKTVSYSGLNQTLSGFKFNCSLYGNEYVEAVIHCKSTSGQKAGNVFINNSYEDAPGQIKEIISNTVSVQVDGSISVVKNWVDLGNSFGYRPKTIKIHLVKDGKNVRDGVLDVVNGKYTFNNVPMYEEDGTPITYTIAEDDVEHYKNVKLEGDQTGGFTLTNCVNPEDVVFGNVLRTGGKGTKTTALFGSMLMTIGIAILTIRKRL